MATSGCGPDTPDSQRASPVASFERAVQGVVLISLDTVRADRLGFLGYGRGNSPNMDGVARRSVVFTEARAQSTQTAPSHASLLTSEFAGAHGIVNVHDGDAEAPVLPPGVVTLAELLSENGVRTAAFVSGGNFTRTMDMDRGFGVWDERNEDIAKRIDALLRWLEGVGGSPFLVMLHSYQAHAPYLPPMAEADRFTDAKYRGELRDTYERYLALPVQEAWARGVGPDYWPPGMVNYSDADVRFLSDLYDGEISYLDSELRRLFEAVLLGPRANDTAMVVVSDHGEEFRDHGKFQHDQVFDELTRVPLMVYLGGELERQGWKGRVEAPVQLIDVAPTVAALLGVEWRDTGWSGRSLEAYLDPARRLSAIGVESPPAFSELVREHRTQTYGSVTWRGWKYILHRQATDGRSWEHLFDLENDPLEKHNLSDSSEVAVLKRLEGLRDLWRSFEESNKAHAAELGQGSPSALSDDQLLELRRLGYTGSPR